MNDRAQSSLRGRLAEVFFPALANGEVGPLSVRLGERATLTTPSHGHSVGLAAIEVALKDIAESLTRWQVEVVASRSSVDRDLVEGTFRGKDGKSIPFAIIAERHKAREVDLRVYHAPFGKRHASASPRNPSELALANDFTLFLSTFRMGDVGAAIDAFETNGQLVDGNGDIHTKATGSLRSYYEQLLQNADGITPWIPTITGGFDDGRAAAIEYRAEDGFDRLLVIERGDSALIREARWYNS